MSFSYGSGLSTALDRIRFALGDTDETLAMLPDETILGALDVNGSDERRATISLAEGLMARYAREPDDVTTEGRAISWRDRLAAWRSLVGRLRSELGTAGGLMQVHRAQRVPVNMPEYYAGRRSMDYER